MIDTNNIRIFNYINCTIIACIVPIGYFAPMGEWLLISFLSLATVIKVILNKFKIHLYNIYILLISIFLLIISYFWSMNPERTIETIGPTSGILISIYIVLNISASNIIKNIHNIIGIPLLLTSLCIFADLVFNTEIRSSFALLAGDKPTSNSGNYSRGIVILTMVLPISVALFIHNKKYIFAFILLALVSTIVFIGPNESAKMALFCSYFAAILIYFLGPKSFIAFGIISLIIIVFSPLISSLALPKIGQINKTIELSVPCVQSGNKIRNIIIKTINKKNLSPTLSGFEKLELGAPVPQETIKFLEDKYGNSLCAKRYKWQETPGGGSIIHRFLVWEYVSKEILKKPILGHGLGTSRFIGQNIILNVPNTQLVIKGGIPLHPHNNFLEIWLELGLLGIIITS